MDGKNKKLSTSLYLIMMGVTIVVWAMAFPLIKIGLKELSFINLTIMRFFIVSLTITILIITKSKYYNKLHKKDIFPIFILGFFGVMCYHFGLNYGEQYISSGAASLIIATIPIFVLILSIFYLKEKITIKKILGIIISLVGVIIISLLGTENTEIEVYYILGAIAVLIAAILGSFYTIAGKKLLSRYNGLSLTSYAMLLGSLGLIPFISSSLFEEVCNLTSIGWFSILFLGCGSSVIGYILWYVVLEYKEASEISVFLYGIPVLSTIISFFYLQETITLYFLLGGFFVLFGLIIVNIKTKS